MKNVKSKAAAFGMIVFACLPCFGQAAPLIAGDTGIEKRSLKVSDTIEQIARDQDQKPDKNWFPTGPRVFKSGYGRVSNAVKAAFAMDLQDWVNEKGEKLSDLTATYIPYKKREEYAMWWWNMHDANYKKCAPWDKDQWKYEAIIDGTQLRWKAAQKMGSDYSAAQIMGHDGLMAQLIKTEGK